MPLTPATLAVAAFCRVMAASSLHRARRARLFAVAAPGRNINRCSRQRPGYALLRQSGRSTGLSAAADEQVRPPGAPAASRCTAPPVRKRERSFRSWPALAVLGLLLATAGILLFNQQHSGQSLKIRRELRKF
ncbi:MAG: hypothetical protein NTW51_14385 [Cyanobacteria bacterium]|nr:hypothetical protein [Cyanobacteriota bacterium]